MDIDKHSKIADNDARWFELIYICYKKEGTGGPDCGSGTSVHHRLHILFISNPRTPMRFSPSSATGCNET